MYQVTLDSEAVWALVDRSSKRRPQVMLYLEAARRLGRPVVVPTIVLAELYRGSARRAAVDACLARSGEALTLRDTDRALARIVGAVLAAAVTGSMHIADAHVVATALEGGGGVIVTGDEDDMSLLAGAYGHITIEAI
jgi:predicted nucleic acid-binding protein